MKEYRFSGSHHVKRLKHGGAENGHHTVHMVDRSLNSDTRNGQFLTHQIVL